MASITIHNNSFEYLTDVSELHFDDDHKHVRGATFAIELQDGAVAFCSDHTVSIFHLQQQSSSSIQAKCIFEHKHTQTVKSLLEWSSEEIVFGDMTGQIHVLKWKQQESTDTPVVVSSLKESHQNGTVWFLTKLNNKSDGGGEMMASGGSDNLVIIWDMKRKSCIQRLEGHQHFVYFVMELKDGSLVSSSYDGTIAIWKKKKQNDGSLSYEHHCALQGHTQAIRKVLELKNGLIASCSWDGTVRLWDALSQTCVRVLTNLSQPQSFLGLTIIQDMIETPEGYIVSVGSDSKIRVSNTNGVTLSTYSLLSTYMVSGLPHFIMFLKKQKKSNNFVLVITSSVVIAKPWIR